jgi:TetR/AcrR family transcriptional repressor of nem operon
MRYAPEHKARVRERIVQTAARRFRRRGSEVAIADLMRDLKLTHGGFYRHFKGKEELFNEAFRASVAQTRQRMAAAAAGAPGRELEAIIKTYLSVPHCDNPGEGCPIAALATEIARHPKSTRAVFEEVLRAHAAAFARFMPGATATARERTAMVLFAGMAGALNLARALTDETLRHTILDQARAFYIQSMSRH